MLDQKGRAAPKEGFWISCDDLERRERCRTEIIDGHEIIIVEKKGCRFKFVHLIDQSRQSRGLGLKEIEVDIEVLPERAEKQPTHVNLYNMLATSKQGVSILKEANLVPEYFEILKNKDTSSNTKRAMLWALSHIGSSKNGV